MTAVAIRQFSARLFEGNIAYPQEAVNLVDKIDDYQPLQPILTGYCSGDIQIAFGVTATIPMPDGYTNAATLLAVLRFDSPCTITVTSPLVALTDKVYGMGSAVQNGIYATQARITAITVKNPAASGTMTVSYGLLSLPDITLEASFRGIQSTGAMSEVPT